MIEKGLCQCGCRQKTSIASKNNSRNGYIKGQPRRFIYGHSNKGSNHPSWKGGKKLDPYGYILIKKLDHPRTDCNGYVREHILIAEEVLGGPLPEGAEIHHANKNKSDNRKENLVICESRAYHMLLHQRMQALKACSHANWRKCYFCKKWDNPKNLFMNNRNDSYHRKCKNQYQKLYRKKLSGLHSLVFDARQTSQPSPYQL